MEKDINHTNQNQQPVSAQKKDIQVYEAISNFIKDKEGIHIYRRAEKICKAYFLLTQHIQNNDSIKLKLRTLALDMSSKTLDLVASINKTEDLARDVAMKAMALVSVSDIAVSAHSISPSNYAVVIGQVQIFVEEVETYWKTMSYNNQAIPTHLFEMDALDASYKNSRTFASDDSHDKHASGGVTMSFNKEVIQIVHNDGGVNAHPSVHASAHASHKVQKDPSKNIRAANNTKPQAAAGEATEAKNDRQTLILSTIKSRGESSIKDLTDVIKGCSEKTIQRELIALVGSGDLLKTGKRRWSRYTAAR